MAAFNDGAAFGKPDTAHVRLNLGTPRVLLTERIERMRTALATR
jgi:bifunctional pyridoxal-dependent enzyme with beta-cystathionase and maltose regulon repressor activities